MLFHSPVPMFIEYPAGLVSVSMCLQGGYEASSGKTALRPLVARQGSKQGYAIAILKQMGLLPGQRALRYLWVDTDPHLLDVLKSFSDPAVLQKSITYLEEWQGQVDKDVYDCLWAEREKWWEHEQAWRVAAWAYMQARSFAGLAIGDLKSYSFAPERYHRKSTNREDLNGVTRVGLVKRLKRIQELTFNATVQDRCLLDSVPDGTVFYADPPYQGTTGYGYDMARSDLVAIARHYQAIGASCYISEATPIEELVAEGWEWVDISPYKGGSRRRSKQKCEILTYKKAEAANK